MDFALSEEQRMFADSVRGFAERHLPTARCGAPMTAASPSMSPN